MLKYILILKTFIYLPYQTLKTFIMKTLKDSVLAFLLWVAFLAGVLTLSNL
jgi:hypothetical protein